MRKTGLGISLAILLAGMGVWLGGRLAPGRGRPAALAGSGSEGVAATEPVVCDNAAMLPVENDGRQRTRFAKPDADEQPWPDGFPVRSDGGPDAWAKMKAHAQAGRLIPLLAEFEAMGSASARSASLRFLWGSGDEALVAAALALIWSVPETDPDRRAYLKVLESGDSPAVAIWLLNALSTLGDGAERVAILETLRAMRGVNATAAIAAHLNSGAGPAVRQDVLAWMQGRSSPSDIRMLKEMALSDDLDVARAAATGLASIGGPDACFWLAAAARDLEEILSLFPVLASGRSPYSQTALQQIWADRTRPEAVRVAAETALANLGPRPCGAESGSQPGDGHGVACDGMATGVRRDDAERWF